MIDKRKFMQQWQSFTPKKRVMIVAAVLLGPLFLYTLTRPPGNLPVKKKGPAATAASLSLPGSVGGDLQVEKLSASLESVKRDNMQMHADLVQTQKTLAEEKSKPPVAGPPNPEMVKELAALKQEVVALKNRKEPGLDDVLPVSASGVGPAQPASGAPGVEDAPPQPEAPALRILGDARRTEADDDKSEEQKPEVYLPAGSNFEGVLLNGMDAPTSSVAKKNPVPALIRLKTDAILPNRFRYDIRECFSIVSGYGSLSTERAILQTVTLSCVKTDGSVIESKIQGYVVGEDGRTGMRGRLISKQGQLLAKSFAAGFLSGIGGAMQPYAVPQLNTNPGSMTQYQSPNLGAIATAGTAQGISTSANTLSKFYLDMAKEMFPVVEIDAERRVTIILLKGVSLNMTGEKAQ